MTWFHAALSRIGSATPAEAVEGGEVHRLDRLLSLAAEKPDSKAWQGMINTAIGRPFDLQFTNNTYEGLPKPGILDVLLKHGAPYTTDDLVYACRNLNPAAVDALAKQSKSDNKTLGVRERDTSLFYEVYVGFKNGARGAKSKHLAYKTIDALLQSGFDINSCSYQGKTVADCFAGGSKEFEKFEDYLKQRGARNSTRDEQVTAIGSWDNERTLAVFHDQLTGDKKPAPVNTESYYETEWSIHGFVASVVAGPFENFQARGFVSTWTSIIQDLSDCIRERTGFDTKQMVDLLDRRLCAACEACGSVVDGSTIITVTAMQSAGGFSTQDGRLEKMARGGCPHCKQSLMVWLWQGNEKGQHRKSHLDEIYERIQADTLARIRRPIFD